MTTITKKIVFTPKENQYENLKKDLIFLTSLSQKEKGCLLYHLYENSNRFIILESWENTSYLDAHKRTTHFTDFKSQTSDLIQDKSSENWNFIF